MITEDYVSFETAKLLKEKGFNEPCHAWQRENENVNYCDIPLDYNDMFEEHNEYLVPTQQMAMKWLREVHKLYINIWADLKDAENNDFDIIFRAQVYNGPSNYGTYEFSTYEQACEAAIKYCLENLI